ncbi:hypothetical protein [Aequorivita echinoideorum]|uniref:Uncharacterized protein n=1 Tax=Aequorivita echinoideorum TaxID=1549647 RepID=A0ABS5S1H0_9FLAO|nr:hypothetical protein [Aequorivita echinoideorum]MBT0607029.1 hypothetical protein [Aequorivita echinoideorum]
MKKKLREQIKALATKILSDEKSFKTASIKESVASLYEKLCVLEYLENEIGDTAENVPQVDAKDSMDSKSFREENWFTEPVPVPQPQHTDDLIEPLMEKIKDIVAQMPEESDKIDEMLDEMLPKTQEPQKSPEPKKHTRNDLEEFASTYQQMPTFERKPSENFPKFTEFTEPSKTLTESRAKSLNDSVKTGLNIGLNDRLAFIKHLFEGQAEDYTRVLSQINTMQSFEEAQSFIKGKVKPDYNYWLNKDEYSERFMNIIEKRFN